MFTRMGQADGRMNGWMNNRENIMPPATVIDRAGAEKFWSHSG